MPSPYDILFEPVQIGPVTAPNRFYQVPHCNGFGHRMPRGLAAMRGIKAEGGWGVVCTEEVEIHHSSDLSPYFEGRLWSDDDIPAQAIPIEDDEVDALYNQVYRELMTFVISDPKAIECANWLLWVAHNLERVADRVTNICERTVFIATGEFNEIKNSDDEFWKQQRS